MTPHSFPNRIFAITLAAGIASLTACTRTTVASNHTAARVHASQSVTGHPAILGDDVPNPAKVVLTGSALERMQSGVVRD